MELSHNTSHVFDKTKDKKRGIEKVERRGNRQMWDTQRNTVKQRGNDDLNNLLLFTTLTKAAQK